MKKEKTNNKIRKYEISVIAVFICTILAVMFSLSTLSLNKGSKTLTDKVASLTSEITTQMRLNFEHYTEEMSASATLVFINEDVYKYDATNPKMDEYEALATESRISDTLYENCLSENYVDFGIVYSNNHIVGKISNGTNALFGENLYKDMAAHTTDNRTRDGWFSGYNDDYKRIYYVKYLNDNAVLITSFYITELEDVFEHPNHDIDITVRLLDSDYKILYSPNREEIGTDLDSDLADRIDGNTDSLIVDDKYLLSINSSGQYYILCSTPTESILKEIKDTQRYLLLICAIIAIISSVVCVAMIKKIVNPVTNIVTNLDEMASHDQLTGLLNKAAFESQVESKLSDRTNDYVLLIMDIDNFKKVNDTLGHANGDKVIASTADIIKEYLRGSDIAGRIGGDEFAILCNIKDKDSIEESIKVICERICNAFHDHYFEDNYKVSVSIGASVFKKDGDSFNELYIASDKALYQSKKLGKDTYSIYSKEAE